MGDGGAAAAASAASEAEEMRWRLRDGAGAGVGGRWEVLQEDVLEEPGRGVSLNNNIFQLRVHETYKLRWPARVIANSRGRHCRWVACLALGRNEGRKTPKEPVLNLQISRPIALSVKLSHYDIIPH